MKKKPNKFLEARLMAASETVKQGAASLPSNNAELAAWMPTSATGGLLKSLHMLRNDDARAAQLEHEIAYLRLRLAEVQIEATAPTEPAEGLEPDRVQETLSQATEQLGRIPLPIRGLVSLVIDSMIASYMEGECFARTSNGDPQIDTQSTTLKSR